MPSKERREREKAKAAALAATGGPRDDSGPLLSFERGPEAPKAVKKPRAVKVTRAMCSAIPFAAELALKLYPPTREQSLSELEKEKLTDATLHLAQSYPFFAKWLGQLFTVGALAEFGMVVGAVAVVHLAEAGVVEAQYGQLAAFGLMMGVENVAGMALAQMGEEPSPNGVVAEVPPLVNEEVA